MRENLSDARLVFLHRWGAYYADSESNEGRTLFPEGFEPREAVQQLASELIDARQELATLRRRWGRLRDIAPLAALAASVEPP